MLDLGRLLLYSERLLVAQEASSTPDPGATWCPDPGPSIGNAIDNAVVHGVDDSFGGPLLAKRLWSPCSGCIHEVGDESADRRKVQAGSTIRRLPMQQDLNRDTRAPRSSFGSGWQRIPLWALFVIPWLWPGWLLHYHHYRLYRFYKYGNKSAAVVLAQHPEDHNSVSFRYVVGAAQYVGQASTPASGLPDVSDLRIGDTVSIIYLPTDPKNAIGGDLKDFWRVLVLDYVMLFVGATFLTLLGVVAKRSLRGAT
jgi:hypothetical protein